MSTPRFLTLNLTTGQQQMGVSVATSTGAAQANSVVATSANGYVDPSLLPAVAITSGTVVASSIASTPVTLTFASSLTVNWTTGMCQKLTLTGNTTLTFSNPVAGAHYMLELTQDATGSRIVTWPTIRWQGGTAPTLTTTASKTDLIVLIYDGTNYFGQAALNF